MRRQLIIIIHSFDNDLENNFLLLFRNNSTFVFRNKLNEIKNYFLTDRLIGRVNRYNEHTVETPTLGTCIFA